MNKLIAYLFLSLLAPLAYTQEPDWGDYALLLQHYVSEKPYKNTMVHWVNYSEMKKDPLFATVVKTVETFPTDRLSNNEEKLSFYINTYNIYAMKVILEKWPVKSIKNVGTIFVPVWHKKAGVLDQKEISLHHLENNILRKLGEPRIHFSVVCASIGCPNLRKEPYTAEKLDKQLTDQTIAFLNDPYRGIQKRGNELHISKIFKWFKADFQQHGGPAQFINQYYPVQKGQLVIADLNYDWGINGD